MTSFRQDLQYALQMIRKTPGYAAIAILTLALGIGANTTIFSWINASLLNPVPGLARRATFPSLKRRGGRDIKQDIAQPPLKERTRWREARAR